MEYRVNVYCNSVKPTCYYVESSHSRALDRIAQLKTRFKHLNSIVEVLIAYLKRLNYFVSASRFAILGK